MVNVFFSPWLIPSVSASLSLSLCSFQFCNFHCKSIRNFHCKPVYGTGAPRVAELSLQKGGEDEWIRDLVRNGTELWADRWISLSRPRSFIQYRVHICTLPGLEYFIFQTRCFLFLKYSWKLEQGSLRAPFFIFIFSTRYLPRCGVNLDLFAAEFQSRPSVPSNLPQHDLHGGNNHSWHPNPFQIDHSRCSK